MGRFGAKPTNILEMPFLWKENEIILIIIFHSLLDFQPVLKLYRVRYWKSFYLHIQHTLNNWLPCTIKVV